MNRFIEQAVLTSGIMITELKQAIDTNDDIGILQSLEVALNEVEDIRHHLEGLMSINNANR